MTINTDILHRLDRLIQLVSGKTYPDDACCHCDQSVGYTCDICAELAILKDAMAEIERLRVQLDEANNRFHRMNTPTGREIELLQENRELRTQADRRLRLLAKAAAILRAVWFQHEAIERVLTKIDIETLNTNKKGAS